ncbi:MAG: hypothetical protein KC419_10820, partial [Anaerolineales bacterium]|nr:hypothetical protein [Anaerolineales bacterium]
MATQAGKVNRAEAAGFSANVDLNHIKSGDTFQATWTFRNSGTKKWNGRYLFAYTSETNAETANYDQSALGAPPQNTFSNLGIAGKIEPGETAALTITFTAPAAPGTYATNWQLQTPQGHRFGPVRWMRVVVEKSEEPENGKRFAYQSLNFVNSVSDFNHMQSGREFTGTWTMRNTGTVTWSSDFQVAYVDEAVSDTQQMMRDPMGAPAVSTLRELTGRDQVRPGETIAVPVTLVAPQQPGAYAFHWQFRTENGRNIGGLNWLQIGVIGSAIGTPPVPTTQTVFGMNINPNQGLDLDVDRLRGLNWVRFVYWASREQKSPEQAYQQRYRHIIQSYANAGIKSLLILHQDTEGGNW